MPRPLLRGLDYGNYLCIGGSQPGPWLQQTEYDQLLIHTDQESQCRTKLTGSCWKNEVVESFFSTLKHELNFDDGAEILNSPQQLVRHLAFWIDGHYNRERSVSTIG